MVDRRSPQQAPTRELLSYFDALHLEHLGERAVITGAKDAKILADLFHSHGLDRVKELMALFFQTDSEFVREAGYTVGVFRSQMPRLIVKSRQFRPKIVATKDWRDECDALHGGRCTNVFFHEAMKERVS